MINVTTSPSEFFFLIDVGQAYEDVVNFFGPLLMEQKINNGATDLALLYTSDKVDGGIKWCEWQTRPMLEKSDVFAGVLAFKDITSKALFTLHIKKLFINPLF